MSTDKCIAIHAEVAFGCGTPSHEITPFDANFDLSFTFAKRFSIHGVAQSSRLIPKNGITSDYNRNLNIGGGVGYIFLPHSDEYNYDYQIRATVLRSVDDNALKNTSYSIGLHWIRYAPCHKLTPTFGVGYNLRDYSRKGMPSYNGGYLSIGLRF